MTTTSETPSWLVTASAQLGTRETPGGAIDPNVAAMFADIGHPEITTSDVAWCAAFVGSCLERSGTASTRALNARSYLDWGQPLTTPKVGAVVVLSRDPDPSLGHVAFYIGEAGNSFLLLGGNQSNCVTVAAFSKSKLLGVRWPLATVSTPQAALPARPPAAVPPPQNPSAVFDAALAHVLNMEGGFTHDPADPGGPTNWGITLADYAQSLSQPITDDTKDQLVVGLKVIPPDAVRAIYLERYWTPSGAPQFPSPIGYFHFDTAVNMGVGTAIRMLQAALDCGIDGEVGPLTLAAVAAADPTVLLPAYADLRRRRYRSLSTFPRFGRGWLARVDTTLAGALTVSSLPSLPPPTSHASTPALQQGPTPMNATPSTPSSTPDPMANDPKWWGQSSTIWGAVITGMAAVLPALGPAIGITVTPDAIHTGADQVSAIIQALVGLAGTFATIRGRVIATQPLTQRVVALKI